MDGMDLLSREKEKPGRFPEVCSVQKEEGVVSRTITRYGTAETLSGIVLVWLSSRQPMFKKNADGMVCACNSSTGEVETEEN